MRRPEPDTLRRCALRRELHRFPGRVRPDLAALIPALGLVPRADSFVLLEGEGWDTQVLAFDPEYTLTVEDASPFKELRRVLAPEGSTEACPPPQGGSALFGYLSYDAARYLERLPTLAGNDLRLPIARFIMSRYAIGEGPTGVWASVPAGEDANFVLRALQQATRLSDTARRGALRAPGSSLGREGYLRAEEAVKEYVRAGDVFQVNISQRFEVPFSGDPLALYGALRKRNPSPFGAWSPFPVS